MHDTSWLRIDEQWRSGGPAVRWSIRIRPSCHQRRGVDSSREHSPRRESHTPDRSSGPNTRYLRLRCERHRWNIQPFPELVDRRLQPLGRWQGTAPRSGQSPLGASRAPRQEVWPAHLSLQGRRRSSASSMPRSVIGHHEPQSAPRYEDQPCAREGVQEVLSVHPTWECSTVVAAPKASPLGRRANIRSRCQYANCARQRLLPIHGVEMVGDGARAVHARTKPRPPSRRLRRGGSRRSLAPRGQVTVQAETFYERFTQKTMSG